MARLLLLITTAGYLWWLFSWTFCAWNSPV